MQNPRVIGIMATDLNITVSTSGKIRAERSPVLVPASLSPIKNIKIVEIDIIKPVVKKTALCSDIPVIITVIALTR